jgi:hypothetical protein
VGRRGFLCRAAATIRGRARCLATRLDQEVLGSFVYPVKPRAEVAELAPDVLELSELLRVYAKCVAGQEEDAKRRISEATRPKTP